MIQPWPIRIRAGQTLTKLCRPAWLPSERAAAGRVVGDGASSLFRATSALGTPESSPNAASLRRSGSPSTLVPRIHERIAGKALTPKSTLDLTGDARPPGGGARTMVASRGAAMNMQPGVHNSAAYAAHHARRARERARPNVARPARRRLTFRGSTPLGRSGLLRRVRQRPCGGCRRTSA